VATANVGPTALSRSSITQVLASLAAATPSSAVDAIATHKDGVRRRDDGAEGR
jgi:hypothetical protein